MRKAFFIYFMAITLCIANINIAFAQSSTSQDNTYRIIFDDSSSGYSGNDTRSTDQSNENILIGGFEPFDVGSGNEAGGSYKIKSGLQPTFEANVAEVALLSNSDGGIALYDRLQLRIDPNDNPTSADGVKFAVQIASDLSFTGYKYVNPTNFQPDSVTNSNLSTYYQPCAQTTNQVADDTRWDCGTVGGLKKFIKGLGANTQFCVRIVAMNGDATNSEPGPGICATTQNLSITFTISPNTANFGVLALSGVNTASPATVVTSYSNAQNGYSMAVTGTGSGSGATSGLHKAIAVVHTILSTNGNLNASIGTEQYGMQGQITSGGATLANAWDATQPGRNSTYVGQILRSNQQVYSRSLPAATNDVVTLSYLATIAPSTPSGVYRDTLIFTMSANW